MLPPEERARQIERLKNMTDSEAYQNALDDPDNPPLTDAQLAEFEPVKNVPGDTLLEKYKNIREKKYKQLISIRFDADVLHYFRAKGKGYQSIMNDALRAFMEAEISRTNDCCKAKAGN